jgi:hypothetical protein
MLRNLRLNGATYREMLSLLRVKTRGRHGAALLGFFDKFRWIEAACNAGRGRTG